jgi:hypothetical protein
MRPEIFAASCYGILKHDTSIRCHRKGEIVVR